MFKGIGDSLFPKRCPFCDDIIPKEKLLCHNCDKQVEAHRIKTILNNSVCISAFPYDGIYRNAVLNLKFGKHKRNAEPLAVYISSAVSECYETQSIDFITAVPLSIKQKRQRGFNQAEVLAKNLADNLNIPYKECLLKTKDNMVQHKLNQKQRKQNVKGVYEISSKEIKGYKILVVDDIITTGFTLEECCKVLKKAGNAPVCCALCKTEYK